MAAEDTDDVEVAYTSPRGRVGGTSAARGVVVESYDPQTGDSQVMSGKGAVQEDVGEGGAPQRRFKESTLKLLDKLENPDEEGDGGPDDPDDPDNTAAAGADEGEVGEGEETVENADGTEGTDETPAPVEEIKQWQTKAQQFEAANLRLTSELEAAKKTPPSQRSEYETQLVDAWKAYVDEGSVPAIRKFIGAIIGAAPDSKEVAQELAGAYIDLTAHEVGVPLDQSQQAMREAARARLALARDKRERAESEKKAIPANSGEVAQIEQAGRYIDGLMNTKSQAGTSLAEEFPLLMTLAEEWDSMKPSVLIARALKREIEIGALTGRESEDVMIRHTAGKIEKHYNATLEKANKARPQPKNPNTDTTKSGTPAAKPASQEKRQNTGARTINNAKASVAPATPPKTKKPEPKTEEKPKFKSKRQQQDYALRHIPE